VDIATHALFGALLVPAERALRDPVVLASSMAGAMGPDLDALSLFLGPEKYLRFHRGPLHSVGAGVGLAALLGGIGSLLTDAPFLLLFGFAVLGHLSHLALDLPLSWPFPALWPFSNRRFSLNFIGFGDRFLLVALGSLGLATVILPPNRREWARIAAAVSVAAYLSYRFLSLRRAREVIRAALPPEERNARIFLASPPVEFFPRRWRAYLLRAGPDPAYQVFTVDARTRTVLESEVIASDPPRAAVDAARDTRSCEAMRRRYPHLVASVEREGAEIVIRWRDVGSVLRKLVGVEARVRLDAENRVTEDRLLLSHSRSHA